MRTREFRRFKQFTTLARRINDFFDYGWCSKEEGYAEFKKKVETGESYKWLRTTANPCNCEMCSGYYKYKRLTLVKVNKMIDEYFD